MIKIGQTILLVKMFTVARDLIPFHFILFLINEAIVYTHNAYAVI